MNPICKYNTLNRIPQVNINRAIYFILLVIIIFLMELSKNTKKKQNYVCPIFVLSKISGRLDNSSNR